MLADHPKGPVQLDVLINPVDRAGCDAAAAVVGIAPHAAQTAPDHVFLRHVEDGPQVVAAILIAPGGQQVVRLDGVILRGLPFSIPKPNSVHGLRERRAVIPAHIERPPIRRGSKGLLCLTEDAIGAFDHLRHGVARMANLDAVQGTRLRHQRIQAPNPEKPRHQVVCAGSVVGVLQEDFANGIADTVVNVVIQPAQADHVLREWRLATNPRDALTTEAYNQQVERICGLMETPPHKIFHYNSVKYDNQSAANAQYANDCLIPIAKNIEEKLRLQLLGEDEIDDHWPEFDRMALLAGDPATLMGILDKALKGGAVEINEVRDRLPLGLNPIEGGDVRYVPVNMAIVDRAGSILHQAATGQPQPTGSEPDQDDETAGGKGLRLAVNND